MLFRPDGTIQEKGSRAKGDNIYNLSGAGQSIRLKGTSKTKFQYTVSGQNDGNTSDNILVSGTGKSRSFKITYGLQQGGNFSNVTGAVSRGSLSLTSLGPGQTSQLRATIKATRKARGQSKTIKIFCSFQSQTEPDKQDRVLSKITAKKK